MKSNRIIFTLVIIIVLSIIGGGLPLVGVATKYPEYKKQANSISDLISPTNRGISTYSIN